MSETDEVYRVTWLTGVKRLEPVKHVATWKSHELFDIVSPIMKWTDCDDLTLSMMLAHGMHIEFTNARPDPPPLVSFFGALKQMFGLST